VVFRPAVAYGDRSAVYCMRGRKRSKPVTRPVAIRDFARTGSLSFAKTSSRLSGRRPMLSQQAKERLGDCRPEGRPAVRVRRAATEGRRTFWGVGRRAA